MKKKYILFDFDGTLINTNGIIIDSWQNTAKHYIGHELDIETIERSFGETIRFTASYLFPGVDPIEAHEYYGNYQKTICDGRVSLFDGVEELLKELKARGYVLAVATSRAGESYRRYMEDLGVSHYFDVSVTMEDVTRHKPDPEAILVTLDKLGARPEEAIMLGDTRFDIGCANNAGVDSVLVKWSHYIDMEQMDELGFKPTHIIENPDELLDII